MKCIPVVHARPRNGWQSTAKRYRTRTKSPGGCNIRFGWKTGGVRTPRPNNISPRICTSANAVGGENGHTGLTGNEDGAGHESIVGLPTRSRALRAGSGNMEPKCRAHTTEEMKRQAESVRDRDRKRCRCQCNGSKIPSRQKIC